MTPSWLPYSIVPYPDAFGHSPPTVVGSMVRRGCRTAKRLTRRLERAAAAVAKRSDATSAASANQAWQTQRLAYRILRNQKRDALWSNTVADNQSSPQQLWRSVDLLLGRGRAPASSAISVDQFDKFFIDKVEAVRNATAGGSPPTSQAVPTLQHYNQLLSMMSLPSSSDCQTRAVLPTVHTSSSPALKLVADLVATF